MKKKNVSKSLALAVALSIMGAGSAWADSYAAGGGSASGLNAVAIGSDSTASGFRSVAVGNKATAYGYDTDDSNLDTNLHGTTIAVGDNAYAYGWSSISIGADSQTFGMDTVALGYSAYAYGKSSLALGAYSETKLAAVNSVALGTDSIATEANTVSVGNEAYTDSEGYSHEANYRRITNVADGTAATDAATVGQITLTDDGTYVKKDADLSTNILALDSAIGEKQDGNYIVAKNTVAQDLTALDIQVKTNADAIATNTEAIADINDTIGEKKDGNYITADNTIAQDLTALDTQVKTNADAITDINDTIGEKQDGNYITADNTIAQDLTALDTQVKTNADDLAAETERAQAAEKKNADAIAAETQERIAGDAKTLSDAKSYADEGDAKTLQAANDYTDQQVASLDNKLTNKINETNDRVDRVGATAAALAGIHYQPMTKGQSQVAIGMGAYKGKKATALGMAYQITDRVSGQISGAANGSEHMMNIGVNYLFGQHSHKDMAKAPEVAGSLTLKEAELQSEVDSLKADNQAMKADNEAIKADNQAMKNEIAELKALVQSLVSKK